MDTHGTHNPFQQHPVLGAIYTLLLAVIGTVIPQIVDSHVPPIVMELLQCGVWTTGLIIGIVTLRGMWKKRNSYK